MSVFWRITRLIALRSGASERRLAFGKETGDWKRAQAPLFQGVAGLAPSSNRDFALRFTAPRFTAPRGITLLFLIFLVAGRAPSACAAPLPGETLPPIELATASGQTRPAWRRGRVTVISFCAFWCDTWKPQSRRLDALRASLRGLPVDWTMISVDGRWSAKAEGGDRNGAWSSIARGALLDAGSRWTHRLDLTSVPYTLVVDARGTILLASQGIARTESLRAAVRVGLGIAPDAGGAIHLAIDDFPSRDAALDDALLDLLRARGLKATFYGSPARRGSSPAIARRAAREGHVLRGVFPASRPDAIPDVIDAFDFKRAGEAELLRRITGKLGAGKTLRLRAGVRETLGILPRLLDGARARGLRVEP